MTVIGEGDAYGVIAAGGAGGGGLPPGVAEDLGGGGPQGPGGPEREFTVKARSQVQMILRRFLAHKLAVISLLVLSGVIVLALVGGHVWHYGYSFQGNDLSQPPSWWPHSWGGWQSAYPPHRTGSLFKHPMGTDNLGHDTFAQILRGANKSVIIALMVAFLSTTFGTVTGALAGYYRGITDTLLMRSTDLFLTVPAIAVAGVLSYQFAARASGWVYLAVILAALGWMPIARVVRGVFLSLREKEYVEAAIALGARDRRIIFRHLLPNVVGPIIVNATLAVAISILAESGLSFLGLGIQPPDTSLGLLVASGVQAAQTRPWLFYFPGLFIIVIVLTVNFVGDGLRDAFDPTQTRVRA
jgi:peptide/nickel transport system permease protein